MTKHHFTLIVDGPDLQDDTLIDAVFEAGCDDAAIGRVDGIQFAEFDREAASLEQAILSAVVDLERIDGVEVVRIADAGLVSMADIATRLDRTREGVRLLISGARGPDEFPRRSPIPAVATDCGAGRTWWSGSRNISARIWPVKTTRSWPHSTLASSSVTTDADWPPPTEPGSRLWRGCR